MGEQSKTACYVLTERLIDRLKVWAQQSDRTASAELRQILEREAVRREVEAAKAGRK